MDEKIQVGNLVRFKEGIGDGCGNRGLAIVVKKYERVNKVWFSLRSIVHWIKKPNVSGNDYPDEYFERVNK